MAFPTDGRPLATHSGDDVVIGAIHRYNDSGATAPSSGITPGINFPILGVPIVPTLSYGSVTPVTKGDLVVDASDSNKLKYYNGSSWVDLTSGGGGGGISLSLEQQGSSRGTVSSGTAIIDFQGDAFQVSTVSGNQWQVYLEEFLESRINNTTNFSQSTIGTSFSVISGSSRSISRRSPLSVMVTFAQYRAELDWDNAGSRIQVRIRFDGGTIDNGAPELEQQDTANYLCGECSGWAWLINSSGNWDYQAAASASSDDIFNGIYQIATF
jgi:hypothetical protein